MQALRLPVAYAVGSTHGHWPATPLCVRPIRAARGVRRGISATRQPKGMRAQPRAHPRRGPPVHLAGPFTSASIGSPHRYGHGPSSAAASSSPASTQSWLPPPLRRPGSPVPSSARPPPCGCACAHVPAVRVGWSGDPAPAPPLPGSAPARRALRHRPPPPSSSARRLLSRRPLAPPTPSPAPCFSPCTAEAALQLGAENEKSPLRRVRGASHIS